MTEIKPGGRHRPIARRTPVAPGDLRLRPQSIHCHSGPSIGPGPRGHFDTGGGRTVPKPAPIPRTLHACRHRHLPFFVNVAPDKAVKHFTAYDPVAKWTVALVAGRATARCAAALLDKLIAEVSFRIEGIQVDGGSEFRAEFEDACRERNLCLFVLPPKRPQLNGHVERAQGSWRYEFYGVEDLPSRLKPLQLGTGLALPDRMGAPDCARTAETGGGGRRLRVSCFVSFLSRLPLDTSNSPLRAVTLGRSWATISPMLAAAPAAQQILLSTPAGASGEFHRAWSSDEDWERVQISADQCPRISAAHLAAERIRLGDALYRQEYFGAFVSAPGSVFDAEVLAHMFGDHTEDEPEGAVSLVEGRIADRFLQ